MTRFSRQSFLGVGSDEKLTNATIGVVGLGGGGSHVIQQLAHLGIGGTVLVDPDIVEISNLNRLVGATPVDVAVKRQKVEVASRAVLSLNPLARCRALQDKWQEVTDALAECDVIIGAVDSYIERNELEAFCRRLMIPYIDMGMDVHSLGEEHVIGGQVILSFPGGPCLWCLGYLNDRKLTQEAERYGDAGAKPQVVWPNGVLASLAVGLAVQLLTPWGRRPVVAAYLEFDGNQHTVANSNRLKVMIDRPCQHYPADQVGDPLFDLRLDPVTASQAEPAAVPSRVVRLRTLWSSLLRRFRRVSR